MPFRLLHLSDLHVGSPLPTAPQRLLERVPGFQGHDPAALLDLDLLLDDSGLSDPDRPDGRLVVTGDLTAYGTTGQFKAASEFLHGRTALAGIAGAGLRVGTTDQAAVAGNHDHWPGSTVFTNTLSTAFSRFFDPHPSPGTPLPLSDGWSLRFLRIDTTQDASGLQRARAQGRCVDQVKTLRSQLDAEPPQGARDVRALLLHHAPSYRSGRLHPLELDAESQDALHGLVRDYRVRALLSGHTHWPVVAVSLYGGADVIDATCGTSAQRTVAGARIWPMRRQPPNSVVVHTLDPQPQSLTWTASVLVRSLGAFGPSPTHTEARILVTPHVR